MYQEKHLNASGICNNGTGKRVWPHTKKSYIEIKMAKLWSYPSDNAKRIKIIADEKIYCTEKGKHNYDLIIFPTSNGILALL